MKKFFFVRLWGGFDVFLEDGSSCLPDGGKSRAIVATLCSAAGFKRSRRWLEAILWGDHPADKASANLRQAVRRLKQSRLFTEGLLRVDASSLWLDANMLEILPRRRHADSFLEGIDVGGEAFEDWLREERQASLDKLILPQNQPIRTGRNLRRPSRPKIFVLRDPSAFNTAVSELFSALRSNLIGLELFEVYEGSVSPETGLMIVPETLAPRRIGLSVIDAANGRLHWSHDIDPDLEDELAAPRLAAACVEALLSIFADEISHPDVVQATTAAKMAQVAFDGLFIPGSYTIDQMETCVEHLLTIAPTGVNFGLRNCVRMLQYGERINGYGEIHRDAVEEDLRRSLEISPHNALVQALAAHTCSLFLDETDAAVDHARQAVSIGSHSGVVATLHALTLLRAGEVEAAGSWALHACRVGSGSRHRAFYIGARACTQAAQGDFHSSLRLARAAKLLSPQFRALNKLLFLGYERTGESEQAEAQVCEIHSTEPDFGRRLLADSAPTVGIRVLRDAMLQSAIRLGLH